MEIEPSQAGGEVAWNWWFQAWSLIFIPLQPHIFVVGRPFIPTFCRGAEATFVADTAHVAHMHAMSSCLLSSCHITYCSEEPFLES